MRNEQQTSEEGEWERTFLPFVHEELSHVLFCGKFLSDFPLQTVANVYKMKSTNFLLHRKERKKCPIARECREKKGIGCNLKGSTDERNWINARWMNYLQHYCCCCSLKLKVFLELFPCIKFNSWATENSSIHHLMNFKPQTIWFRFNKDV